MESTIRDHQWFEVMKFANEMGIQAITLQIKKVRQDLKKLANGEEILTVASEEVLEHLIASKKLLQVYQEDFKFIFGMQQLLSVDLHAMDKIGQKVKK